MSTACPLPTHSAEERAERGRHAGLHGREMAVDLQRGTIGKELDRQPVGQKEALSRRVNGIDLLGPPIRLGAMGAEGQDRKVDQLREALGQRLDIERLRPGLGDRRVMHENIGALEHIVGHGAEAGLGLVDQAALARCQIGKQRARPRSIREERRLRAQAMPRAGFEQCHLGAQNRQQPSAIGCRDALGELDHSHARERLLAGVRGHGRHHVWSAFRRGRCRFA